jgi:hypothetical protein
MNINSRKNLTYSKKEPQSHMKINTLATTLGVAALAFAAFVPAQAQTSEQFTSITGGTGTFTYTSGIGGGLQLSPAGFYATLDVPVAGTLYNNPATVMFTGLGNNGGTTETTDAHGNTSFDQSLKGGNFTITDGTSQVLLAGTFAGADLTGTPGSTQASVATNFFGVDYTGGLYLSTAGLATGPQTADTFNFSLINTKPSLSVTNGALDSFTSAGNGQFTGITAATPVPEAATVVPFAMGGLALLFLAARKSRRNSSVAV